MTISVAGAFAQSDTIRYVNAKTGKYANDGKTWATAKDNKKFIYATTNASCV